MAIPKSPTIPQSSCHKGDSETGSHREDPVSISPIKEDTMNQYDRLYNRTAGITLIASPLLITAAAWVAAAGIGSSTGRWYDNFPEGALMVTGFSLLFIGLQALSRQVGQGMPRLGIVLTVISALGIAGALMPSFTRIAESIMIAKGITADQLDPVHNSATMAPAQYFILPFILCFFLSFLLAAYGLWRVKAEPRWAALLLAVGAVLFLMAQAPDEPNMVLYVTATTAWLLGLAPLGLAMLRDAGPPGVHTLETAASEGN
jgi:hypothetical protein